MRLMARRNRLHFSIQKDGLSSVPASSSTVSETIVAPGFLWCVSLVNSLRKAGDKRGSNESFRFHSASSYPFQRDALPWLKLPPGQ